MASSSSKAGGEEVRMAGIWPSVKGSGGRDHGRLCRSEISSLVDWSGLSIKLAFL